MRYFVESGAQTLIACFQGSRDPAHWQKRV
jgi:hypothetical protein